MNNKVESQPSSFRDEVGSRLREIENEFKNREEAAKAAGVSKSAFQAWVLGKADPSFEGLSRLAKATGYLLDWIATGEGPKSLGEVHADHALHEANAPHQAKAAGGLDDFLLVDTVVEVEDLLDLEGLTGLDSLKKAQLILLVYKRRLESRESGERFTSADIVRLVRGK